MVEGGQYQMELSLPDDTRGDIPVRTLGFLCMIFAAHIYLRLSNSNQAAAQAWRNHKAIGIVTSPVENWYVESFREFRATYLP